MALSYCDVLKFMQELVNHLKLTKEAEVIKGISQCIGDPSHWWEGDYQTYGEASKIERCPCCNSPVTLMTVVINGCEDKGLENYRKIVFKKSILITPDS